MPNKPWVLMLTSPPFPSSALANISLPLAPVGGRATINSPLIVTLPPLAWLLAVAEIRLSFSRRSKSVISRMMLPPSPLAISALIVALSMVRLLEMRKMLPSDPDPKLSTEIVPPSRIVTC